MANKLKTRNPFAGMVTHMRAKVVPDKREKKSERDRRRAIERVSCWV